MAYTLMTDAIAALLAVFELNSFRALTGDQLFESIHDTHNVAYLRFPALTIGPYSLTPRREDAGFSGSDLIENFEIILSVRVHSGYSIQPLNFDLMVELTDDVIEQLKTHISAASGYRLMECEVLSYNDNFAESDTVGATVQVTLHSVAAYSQE